jgi:hypothetical protein
MNATQNPDTTKENTGNNNTPVQNILMETAPEMQKLISQIMAKHGLEVGGPWTYLLLEQADTTTLHIENTRKNEIGVVEVGIKDGQRYVRPYALFFTGGEEWVPIAYARYNFPSMEEDYDGFIYLAGVSEDRTHVTYITHRDDQSDLADYCEAWAEEMIATQWLDKGTCKRIGGVGGSRNHPSMLPLAL